MCHSALETICAGLLSSFAFEFILRRYTAALGGLSAVLEVLVLGSNQLKSVPPELGMLTALTVGAHTHPLFGSTEAFSVG
jgi:hypothetical protein